MVDKPDNRARGWAESRAGLFTPSDRVRSGDGANITVDIQRGLFGSLLPSSLTRFLDRVSICVGSLLYTRSGSIYFFLTRRALSQAIGRSLSSRGSSSPCRVVIFGRPCGAEAPEF